MPVESVACSLAPRWKSLGVKTDASVVLFAAWVDNYYSFGNSCHSAKTIAETFETKLFAEWGLTSKPSSRCILSPFAPVFGWDSDKWPVVDKCDILGHVVSADASPWPCWRKTEKSMWAAFWGNCVGPCNRGLSIQQQCMLLSRSVQPVQQFRNTRWPFTKTLANSQDRVQRFRFSSH